MMDGFAFSKIAKIVNFIAFTAAIALLRPAVTQADEILPAEDRMMSCDASIAVGAALEMLNDPIELQEPLELFMPAKILFDNGRRDEALFWFYAVQLRARYQLVFQKGDRGQLLSVVMMTIGPGINNYGFQDVAKLDRTLARVLQWDQGTPNMLRDKPRSPEIDAQVAKIYSGFQDLRDKLSAEGPALEAQAKSASAGIERTFVHQEKSRCREGKMDPMYRRQEEQKEKKRVVEFARNHPEVIRSAGTVNRASVESSFSKEDEIMPSRYIVSLRGQKRVYAVIDVARSDPEPTFTLTCTTFISLGQRDNRDECDQ